MARGRGGSKKFTAKGRSRYVATEDEIIARNQELERRKPTGESDEGDAEEVEDEELQEEESDQELFKCSSEGDSDESDSEDSTVKPFIIHNPNRNPRPIEKTGIKELSRREKEELERQRFEKNKYHLMAKGKLKTAQADLARLAEIRKAREAAMAKKMENMSLKQ